MKRLLILLTLLVFLAITGCKQDFSTGNFEDKLIFELPEKQWEEDWVEDFDGTELNEDFWSYDTGNGKNGWGNQEQQYYQPENVRVEDGNLIITAKKESVDKFDYTSGRINTKGKKSWKYGKFEIYAKLPDPKTGASLWAAVWMLPEASSIKIGKSTYSGWPKTGEIDILESIGNDDQALAFDTVMSNTHWWTPEVPGGYSANAAGKTVRPDGFGQNTSFGGKFHLYTVEWDSLYIQGYVDNIRHFVKRNEGGTSYPFNHDFHLILNLAVGGTLVYANRTVDKPRELDFNENVDNEFVIDYIKVYKEVKSKSKGSK